MRTAIKILVIVGCSIGFIWSMVVLFGGFTAGCFSTLVDDVESADKIASFMAYTIFSFILLIPALVFGILASKKDAGKGLKIVMGILLIMTSIGITALKSWIAGPVLGIAGLLGFIHGLISKAEPFHAQGGENNRN